jgi:hypothetical protein
MLYCGEKMEMDGRMMNEEMFVSDCYKNMMSGFTHVDSFYCVAERF